MQMVKIRFTNDEHENYVVDLAKRMRVVGFRSGFYVIPATALTLLDEWGCEYEVVERGGYDALVVPRCFRRSHAGIAAGGRRLAAW